MAQKITTIPASGKMPLDRSVKRLNALPDHPDLYFTSLGSSSDTGVDTAYGFAKNSALACVGNWPPTSRTSASKATCPRHRLPSRKARSSAPAVSSSALPPRCR